VTLHVRNGFDAVIVNAEYINKVKNLAEKTIIHKKNANFAAMNISFPQAHVSEK